MTKTIFENGSSAGASYGNQWQQAADVVISGAQHAPGIGIYLGDAEVDLQTAAAVAKAKPGSTLKLAPGATYTVTAPVDVTGLTVDMVGATIKVADEITAPNVLVTTGDLTVIGGTIDGNKANTTDPGSNSSGNGIYAHGTSWGKINITGTKNINCWQRGINIARSGSETDAANVPDCPTLLDSVTVSGCGTYGIFAGSIGQFEARGCTSQNNGGNGLTLQLCRSPLVSGGQYSSNTTHGIAGLYCADPRVAGATCNSNGTHGITFGRSSGNTTNANNLRGGITGNTCKSNGGSGICIDPTISGQSGIPQAWGGAITGNTCNDNTVHGILTTAMSRASITGNTCDNNNNCGISLNSSNLAAVSGNTLTNNHQYGLAFNATGSPSSGFYGRHTVGGNIFDGNTSGATNLVNSFHDPSTFTSTVFRETFGAAAPTTGTWAVADRCWNTAPASGQPIGWICTVAGTGAAAIWSPMASLA